MGYLHGVKPKMTGGLNQETMEISPEAHKEWRDKGGKHSIDSGIAMENPSTLSDLETITKMKSANSDKMLSNQHSDPESKSNPFKPGQAHGKGPMGNELTKLKKKVKSGGMGAKMGAKIAKKGMSV
jgi:hypothetical protein